MRGARSRVSLPPKTPFPSPLSNACHVGYTWCKNINHKGLQRTANEYAEERRIHRDLISEKEEGGKREREKGRELTRPNPSPFFPSPQFDTFSLVTHKILTIRSFLMTDKCHKWNTLRTVLIVQIVSVTFIFLICQKSLKVNQVIIGHHKKISTNELFSIWSILNKYWLRPV